MALHFNYAEAYSHAQANANYFGEDYIVFTDTSGNIRSESLRSCPKTKWQAKFTPFITKGFAERLSVGRTLYHKTLRNEDGSALRARVNGKCRTWKREPERFELPMKHGMRDCFYITNSGAQPGHDWMPYDPTEEERQEKFRNQRKTLLRERFKLADDCPDCILRDRLLDEGMDDLVAELFTK